MFLWAIGSARISKHCISSSNLSSKRSGQQAWSGAISAMREVSYRGGSACSRAVCSTPEPLGSAVPNVCRSPHVPWGPSYRTGQNTDPRHTAGVPAHRAELLCAWAASQINCNVCVHMENSAVCTLQIQCFCGIHLPGLHPCHIVPAVFLLVFVHFSLFYRRFCLLSLSFSAPFLPSLWHIRDMPCMHHLSHSGDIWNSAQLL